MRSGLRAVAVVVAASLITPFMSASLGVLESVAHAAPTAEEVEIARMNFKEGLDLEKAGDYENALSKFEATAKVKTTPQVRFHIALCNEKLGHWAAAIDHYEAASKQATEEKIAPEVVKACSEAVARLKTKMPKLTIVWAKGTLPENVTVDGVEIAPEKLKEHPLDPGTHVVIATRGETKVREEIKLAEGENKKVTLDATGVAVPVYEHPSEKPKERPVVVDTDTGSGRKTVGWVLTGVGVVGIGTGIAFLAIRGSKVSDLETACSADMKCPSSMQGTLDSAKTATTISRIAFGVGIVSLGAGIFFLVTGKSAAEPPKETGVKLVPWAPNASAGFGLEGAF